jgi:regulatory protein
MNVYLDGRFSFSLGVEVAVKEKLEVGQEVSGDRTEALVKKEQYRRCFEAALRYLGYRPRSESEVRFRLRRRGFSGEDIETAITRLKEQSLLDDEAFARFWKDNRESFSPRSQRLTRMELRRKGVVGDVIDRVVDELDDTESAHRAALSKVRHWPRSDYDSFRRRLGEYLRRRGYSYEVINSTVEQVWKEPGNSAG